MRFLRFLPVLLALAAARTVLADTPAYTITDLGALLPGSTSNASAINAGGQVGGTYYASNGSYGPYAFVWTPGQGPGTGIHDIGQVANANITLSGLNASGQAVGSAPSGVYYQVYSNYTYTSYLSNYGFLTAPNGQITQSALVPPAGGRQCAVTAVNTSGEIVGQTGTSQPYNAYDGPQHGFALIPGQTPTLLPTLGGQTSAAYSLNDSGLIVGSAALAPATSNYPQHAALWQNGQTTDLGTLGGQNSTAYGINALGQIVGQSDTSAPGADMCSTPFSGRNGQMTDLSLQVGGSYGKAESINLSGQVVGLADNRQSYPYPGQSAMLWQSGQAYDLNTLLVGDTGWTLTDAAAINDSGQVAGSGRINGQTHAYLLTPAAPDTPRVSSLSPNRAHVGDGDLTVTLTGSGFAADAIVQWNGVALTTTYVSSTQLTALVPGADLTAAMQASVTVVGPSSGPSLGQLYSSFSRTGCSPASVPGRPPFWRGETGMDRSR